MVEQAMASFLDSSVGFACPTPFRSPLLPLRNSLTGAMPRIECFYAEPLHGGRDIRLTRYTKWLLPEHGIDQVETRQLDPQPLVQATMLIQDAMRDAGLSPVVEADTAMQDSWDAASRTLVGSAVALPAGLSFLADVPLMNDALAQHGLMMQKHKGLQRIENGRPVGDGIAETAVIERARALQRRTSQDIIQTSPAKKAPFGMLGLLKAAFIKPPAPLYLDKPYADVEALSRLVANEPETIEAVIASVKHRPFNQDSYKAQIAEIVLPTLKQSAEDLRIAFALANYELNREETEKYCNRYFLDFQRNVVSGDIFGRQGLNAMLSSPLQSDFYRTALLVCYYKTAMGTVPKSVQRSWLRPFTPSNDTQMPNIQLVERFYYEKLALIMARETRSSIFRDTRKCALHVSRMLRNEPIASLDKSRVITSNGKGVYSTHAQTGHGNIPADFVWDVNDIRWAVSCKVVPTAARLLQYSDSWWRSELTAAQMRPDLVMMQDRHLIPKDDLAPALPAPRRPESSSLAYKLPDGKIGELEI